jgi:hypothetical protein
LYHDPQAETSDVESLNHAGKTRVSKIEQTVQPNRFPGLAAGSTYRLLASGTSSKLRTRRLKCAVGTRKPEKAVLELEGSSVFQADEIASKERIAV